MCERERRRERERVKERSALTRTHTHTGLRNRRYEDPTCDSDLTLHPVHAAQAELERPFRSPFRGTSNKTQIYLFFCTQIFSFSCFYSSFFFTKVFRGAFLRACVASVVKYLSLLSLSLLTADSSGNGKAHRSETVR